LSSSGALGATVNALQWTQMNQSASGTA